MQFDLSCRTITGPAGSLVRPQEDDEILRKLAMLIEGECEGLGPTAAATKYGYTKQRYYQLLAAFRQGGCLALRSRKPGPQGLSRRTPAVTREVIRHRFLAPDASADVIAQKIRQTGPPISTRSVSRVLDEFGLQKKTLCVSANRPHDGRGVLLQAGPSTATFGPQGPRERRAAGSGRQGQRQPRRLVAAHRRAPPFGHLGPAV